MYHEKAWTDLAGAVGATVVLSVGLIPFWAAALVPFMLWIVGMIYFLFAIKMYGKRPVLPGLGFGLLANLARCCVRRAGKTG